MMRRSWFSGLEMDVLIPVFDAPGLLVLVGLVGEASARDCVVRPLCLCDIAWCWSDMAMLILN